MINYRGFKINTECYDYMDRPIYIVTANWDGERFTCEDVFASVLAAKRYIDSIHAEVTIYA